MNFNRSCRYFLAFMRCSPKIECITSTFAIRICLNLSLDSWSPSRYSRFLNFGKVIAAKICLLSVKYWPNLLSRPAISASISGPQCTTSVSNPLSFSFTRITVGRRYPKLRTSLKMGGTLNFWKSSTLTCLRKHFQKICKIIFVFEKSFFCPSKS